MTQRSPFRYFKTSPEVIRLAVMLYVRFPLSLRNVEDLLHESGIEVSHETVRYWWQRFGRMFAAEIRRKRAGQMRTFRWRWHLNWRAIDHTASVLFCNPTGDTTGRSGQLACLSREPHVGGNAH